MTNEEMVNVATSIIADYGIEYAKTEHVLWLVSTGVHPTLANAIVNVAIEYYGGTK